MAGLNSILIFLIAAAPIKTVDLAGEAGGTFTGMDTMALDAKGMFVAIIVALTSVQLTHFLKSIIWLSRCRMRFRNFCRIPSVL